MKRQENLKMKLFTNKINLFKFRFQLTQSKSILISYFKNRNNIVSSNIQHYNHLNRTKLYWWNRYFQKFVKTKNLVLNRLMKQNKLKKKNQLRQNHNLKDYLILFSVTSNRNNFKTQLSQLLQFINLFSIRNH